MYSLQLGNKNNPMVADFAKKRGFLPFLPQKQPIFVPFLSAKPALRNHKKPQKTGIFRKFQHKIHIKKTNYQKNNKSILGDANI